MQDSVMYKMVLCVLVLFSFTVIAASSGIAQNGVLCSEDQIGCQNGTSTLHSSCVNADNCSGTGNGLRSQRLRRQSNVCTLPLQPDNGRYEVANVPDAHPGQTFDYVGLTVSCRRGYGIAESTTSETTSLKVYCINGKWSQSMPKCVRFCKLEPDPSVRYMCHVSGSNGFRTCDKYVAPGTSVSPVCNSPIYYSAESLLYMKCTAGTWNYIARCKAECGRVTPEGKQLIIDGGLAKRGELPWHVGVYRKTTTPYRQICGGSLVSNSVVISAAHCFWHDVKKLLPSSDYAVAIGKLYRPWHDKHDVDAQTSDVKDIMITRLFQGAAANFQEDIAILVLVSPFVYKTYVRPVCLSFDTNFDTWQLQPGKVGKVAGWGLTTANGRPSQVLKVVELPYVSTGACITTLPTSFREYITRDKFCAGYTNGTSLCQGDSGGGLAFPDKELGIDRYYLRGIVSAAPRTDDKSCNDEAYTTFTQILKHEEFIKQSLAAFDKNICQVSEFQCSDGECVDQDAECNGKQECADASDESEELCKAESTSNSEEFSDSCILPPYPNHGTYKVANLESPRPGLFLDSFVLTVTCDEGYGIPSSGGDNETSNHQVYCVNGAWYQIMPKCVRFCKVQPDPSIRFVTCQVPGSGFTTCSEYVAPRTTVIPTCNTPNYFSTQVLPFMTCLSGTWDYVATCQPAFCKLDPEPNTRYMCRDAEADQFTRCDTRVNPGITVKPICDNPDNTSARVLQDMTCTFGAWNYVAKCKTDFCQLDPDSSIHYMCRNSETNELEPCSSTVAVGTIVTPTCNTPFYYSPDTLPKMTCTDESWDYVPKCLPECGRITTVKLQTTHHESINSDDGVFIVKSEIIPWHVEIKRFNDIKVHDLGTLIRDDLVVTDAHSYYDIVRRKLDTFTRYVAVMRETGFLDINNRMQQSDVKTIKIPDVTHTSEGVVGDIAILVLATPFKLNLFISPVCVDFDIDFEEQQLAPGNTVKVGYRGQSDNHDIMPITDLNSCKRISADIEHIFEDKICTTYSAGSVPFLSKHANAGVMVPRNESGSLRYYLRGILDGGCYSIDTTTNQRLCYVNYAWATRLSSYKEFILKYLTSTSIN